VFGVIYAEVRKENTQKLISMNGTCHLEVLNLDGWEIL